MGVIARGGIIAALLAAACAGAAGDIAPACAQEAMAKDARLQPLPSSPPVSEIADPKAAQPDTDPAADSAQVAGRDDDQGEEAAEIAAELPEVSLPRVLSDADVARYREIFALQRAGRWHEADRLIRQLDDRILMGHVLYQRLMHPTAYRARYAELRDWLRHYRDHPGAEAVYRLALRRGGRNARPPRPPSAALPFRPAEPEAADRDGPPRPPRAAQEEREVRAFFGRLAREIRRRHLEHAERYSWAMLRTGLLGPDETAAAFGLLAKAYFLAGDDGKALALADIGREESAPAIAHDLGWYGGLAAFRLGRMEMADALFRLAAEAGSPGERAAAAFWAARAAWRLGESGRAAAMLRRAARQRESFYGLIALRLLGDPLAFDWRRPGLDPASLDRLMERAAVRRILALAEVGEAHKADEEMRLLLARSEDADWPALAALASALKLPASQLALTRLLSDETVTAAMRYPLPDWEPEGGFKVDRALLFAFMRQESKFRTKARSRVGASGLMQVMPATASYVTGDRSLRWQRSRLYDPAFNMAVGQQYITYLLDLEPVGRSLVLLAAAYNAGPGNLQRWRRTLKTGEDPLLFIEAIPIAETRDYIERVLANLWLYRLQLGQEVPSLDALASGAWPVYEPLDEEKTPALADAGAAAAGAR